MFLNMLSNEEQLNFLEVAYFSMGVNGTHKDEEQEMFNSYKFECQQVDYKVHKQENIEDVINQLKTAEKNIKKIIIIELFGILFSDDDFCEAESSFMDSLASSFSIEEYELSRIQRWVEAFNDIVQEGYELILR